MNLNDKEIFILSSLPHIYSALFALEVRKLNEKVKLFDTVLAFSLETLNTHQDYFTEYALTSGKST